MVFTLTFFKESFKAEGKPNLTFLFSSLLICLLALVLLTALALGLLLYTNAEERRMETVTREETI